MTDTEKLQQIITLLKEYRSKMDFYRSESTYSAWGSLDAEMVFDEVEEGFLHILDSE